MKKLSLLFLLPILLFSCSSDDNEPTQDQLEFIQIKVTSDDAIKPRGVISLFYLGDDDDINHFSVWDNGTNSTLVYALKDNGDKIYPISNENGNKLGGSTLENYSVVSFFWRNLSTRYGLPIAGKKYAIGIKINEGNYPVTYKVLTIDNNKKITVHIPSVTKIGEFVEAQWSIENY